MSGVLKQISGSLGLYEGVTLLRPCLMCRLPRGKTRSFATPALARGPDLPLPPTALRVHQLSSLPLPRQSVCPSLYHQQFHNLSTNLHSRYVSSTPASEQPTESSPDETKSSDSFGVRLLRLVGWMGGFYSRKAVLLRSAKALYENCADELKYEEFFEACSLPDTFQSWFLITHLHVWMLLVRLKREGEDGAYLIRELTATFWYDVESRMRTMGVHSGKVASHSLRELLYQFYGLTLAYEEGLLSSDKVLAAAVWRNMVFDKPADTDPVRLAKMVDYIRKQVKYMDQLDSKELIESGSLSLLGFDEPYREIQPGEQSEEREGEGGGGGKETRSGSE